MLNVVTTAQARTSVYVYLDIVRNLVKRPAPLMVISCRSYMYFFMFKYGVRQSVFFLFKYIVHQNTKVQFITVLYTLDVI